MTWDRNPPAEPPVDAGTDAPRGPDPAATPTLDRSPTWDAPTRPEPAVAAAGPPPPNPAWPGRDDAATRPVGPPAAPPVLGAGHPPSQTPVPPAFGAPPPPPPAGTAVGWGGPIPEPPRRGRGGRAIGAGLLAVALVGAGFGVRALTEDDAAPTVVRETATVATVPDVTIDPEVEPLAAVAQLVSPSVVQIELSGGLGSGVVFDQGLILTNAHVVGDASTVTVRTSAGEVLEGRVLGTDTGTDIAVVRVNSSDLPAVAIAPDEPVVGQTAVALGSPFGLDQTVTAGIVSAVDRPVDNDRGIAVNMIQTDASINPGNSGGALVDRNGALIGINTAIFSQSGENNGIGFAIPVEVALDVAGKLEAGESTARAGLGLTGPSDTPTGATGAYVQSVVPDGPAEAAGIRAGDSIVAVDGDDIRSFDQLRGVISAYSPGDEVTVTLEREGQTLEVGVTLGTLGG
jgi:putative serine protease PepD